MSNCNIDPVTGIHYGVIAWNDAAGLLFNWCDRSTPYAANCECRKNCRCESDGSYYQDHEYLCHANDRGEILVLKSPYYTLCGPCSPCVPNAGDLTSRNGVLPSYCLGPEWFDMDETPYVVLAVANKQLGVPYKRKRQNPVRR